jgi:hypothetical protein
MPRRVWCRSVTRRLAQGIIATYGSIWQLPTALLGGRLLKFGAQIDLN